MPYRNQVDKVKFFGRYVPSEGTNDATVMLVGERPGIDEAIQERVFCGLAGKELDRYLESVGLLREDVYITNVVKTYQDRDPNAAEIADWLPVLYAEIAEVKPTFIAALGAFAMRALLGDEVTMDMAHGIPHGVFPDAAASILACGFDTSQVCVCPVYHPAAAFYNPDVGKFVQYDFQQLAAMVKGSVVRAVDNWRSPSYFDIDSNNMVPFGDGDIVAIDTEGWQHNPWCLSVSAYAGLAHCIRTPNIYPLNKYGHAYLHNSLHDLPVLDALGNHVPEGKFTDTMVLAYLLGCEPQGLKDLAYRHCGMKMKSYDDVLAPAERQITLDYLRMLNEIEWGPTDPYILTKIKDGEQNVRVVHPNSLNQYITRILKDTESKGADPRKRWNNIEPYIKSQAEEIAGPMPEPTLDDIPLQEAVNYACRDADATLRIAPILLRRVSNSGQDLVSHIDHSIIPMVNRMQTVGMAVDLDHFKQLASRCDIIMQQKVEEIRALTGCLINPNSDTQVRALLFDTLNLPPQKKTEGGEESTNDKVLTALLDFHPAVELITEYRGASKVRDAFCIPIPRYSSRDGRIHPNIRITRVSSGRLSATNPNLLAIPVRDELGREVRRGFVAGPGRVLATWDLNQVEMRHMTHESGDEGLIKIFNEDLLDVHGETAANIFGVPYDVAMSDKDQYRYPAKRVGFGVITGITGHGLVDQMRLARSKIPWTEESCNKLIDDWFRVRPGVKNYMEDCKAECRRYGLSRDCWGRVRYLPAIHSFIPRIREEAGRQSHSHRIQAGAQGIIKVAMADIWQEIKKLRADGFYVECLLQVHDELIFEFDDNEFLWQVLDELVIDRLTRSVLKFFPEYRVRLKAAGARGATWADLEK